MWGHSSRNARPSSPSGNETCYTLHRPAHTFTFSLGSFFLKRVLMTGTRPSLELSTQQHCTTTGSGRVCERTRKSFRLMRGTFSPSILLALRFQPRPRSASIHTDGRGSGHTPTTSSSSCDQETKSFKRKVLLPSC